MNRTPFRTAALACMTALALTACGGGSDDAAAPMTEEPGQVPASATVSASAFTTYALGLPARDDTEPLTLMGLVPPVSDSDEPLVLR